jgi:hypothetical protein
VITQQSLQLLWKSSVTTKINGDVASNTYATYQVSTMASIYLKHLHPFFQRVPLTKGVFMKLTLYLNISSVTFNRIGAQYYGTDDPSNPDTPFNSDPQFGAPDQLLISNITQPLGGTVPIMIASANQVISPATIISQSLANAIVAGSSEPTWSGNLFVPTYGFANDDSLIGNNASRRCFASFGDGIAGPNIIANISVGYKCLDTNIRNAPTGKLGQSVQLVLPAYTMNPVFEQAYLTNSIKRIKYMDYYQYPTNITAPGQFNYLITNGIAGLREIVIFPFLSPVSGGQGVLKYPQYQNPFDSCGGGTVCPLSFISQFNVLLSGQNMSYSTIRYSFEEFQEQFYGRSGAVNAGLTDGITSGLIGQHDWEMAYGVYFVDLSRMLAVEDSVPKSVSIQGINNSIFNITYMVFLGFEVNIGLDVLTGARV